MIDIIVPEFYKRSGRYDEMKGRDPLDTDRVAFVGDILIPRELHNEFAQAAALRGMDVQSYIIAKAAWAMIHENSSVND